jgi:hypothetical protein
MEYFWKENKRYAIAVGGGLLVFLLADWFVLSPMRSKAVAASKKLELEKRELEARIQNGVPGEDGLRQAAAERDQTRKLIAQAAADASFKPADKFKMPREGAKAHYEDLKIKTYDALKERSVNVARIPFAPNFGLGDDVPEGQIEEYLLRLAVAERLGALAIESKVEKVETIDALAGSGRGSGEAEPRKGVFMVRHSVLMKFSGSSDSVVKVLHGAQKKGQYLAVTGFDLKRSDSSKDLLDATITVALLKVDEKAPLEPRAEQP